MTTVTPWEPIEHEDIVLINIAHPNYIGINFSPPIIIKKEERLIKRNVNNNSIQWATGKPGYEIVFIEAIIVNEIEPYLMYRPLEEK